MRNVRLLVNPYAKYLTSIDLPGLRVTGGQEYHYPWVDPEAPAPVSVATASQGLAPGWSILPGYVVGEKGKGSGMRQQVFKLLYQGRDSGKFALTAVAAAELSHKLDPATMQRRKPTWWKAQAKSNSGSSPEQLLRARALNAQYDRDHYTGSSRAQLAQARALEAAFDRRTDTSSPRQLAYARQLGSEYDQENNEGSSAAQLAYARALGAEFDLANDNPRSRKRLDYSKLPNAELRRLAAQGDSRAATQLENNEMAYQEWQSRQAKENPVWVTPAGSAVRHTDAGWAAYQAKHKGVRLPAQAAREADLEAQTRVLAPGWSVRESQKRKSGGEPYTAYCLYFNGQDTGKYALDIRKAVEISWRTDPETGKRKGK